MSDVNAEPVEPTQVRYPWQAVKRTIVQQVIPTLIIFGIVFPQVIQFVLEESGESMPPRLRVWLLAASGFVVGGAAVLAKVMAIPQVDAWLRRNANLGAKPKR